MVANVRILRWCLRCSADCRPEFGQDHDFGSNTTLIKTVAQFKEY